MAQLAAAPERRAHFVEDKRLGALSTPLRSEGTLAYRRPDHLEKTTVSPQFESLVIDGGRLIVRDGSNDPPRVFMLDGHPEIAALVDTVRGAVAGDLALLRRRYDVTGSGTKAAWTIVLRPRDPALARLVQQVDLAGDTVLRTVQTRSANGDIDTLTITPDP